MYQNEEIISREIATPDAEKDFQVRYIREENVGILTTPTDKSYFILDSGDYWYDLIQEKYPPVMKCSCRNDRFNLTFDYTPRAGTEDFREVSIRCACTACGKSKQLPPVKIDYSPSAHLFDRPITFCRQPKIKYKTYSLTGYWSDDELVGMAEYLLKKGLFVYCWYWDPQDARRHFKELPAAELCDFLTGNGKSPLALTELPAFLKQDKKRYLAIYFSDEPFDRIPVRITSDEKGICVQDDIWRKYGVIMLHGPMMVMTRGMFYQMDFCSEYLDKDGNIVPKSGSFCALVKDFQKFGKKLLNK